MMMLQLVAGQPPSGAPLDRFLQNMSKVGEAEVLSGLRRRSAWSSTFTASLELARQGDVALGQAVNLTHPGACCAAFV
jgi:hypothetical protein